MPTMDAGQQHSVLTRTLMQCSILPAIPRRILPVLLLVNVKLRSRLHRPVHFNPLILNSMEIHAMGRINTSEWPTLVNQVCYLSVTPNIN